jgi:hypothetical protein
MTAAGSNPIFKCRHGHSLFGVGARRIRPMRRGHFRGAMRTGNKDMAGAKRVFGAALACAVGLGFHVPGSAQQEGSAAQGMASEIALRERNTNRALLDALLERRAEIVRMGEAGQSRDALDFLDRRIAEVKRRLGQ